MKLNNGGRMKHYIRTRILGLVGMAMSGGMLNAQTYPGHGPDWPDWAYGYLQPLSPGDRIAPTCAPTDSPLACRFVGPPDPDDGIKRTLPDTANSFTAREADYRWGPADWYPGDHDVNGPGSIFQPGKTLPRHAGDAWCGLCEPRYSRL